jgi:CRISPR-associated protein Csd1
MLEHLLRYAEAEGLSSEPGFKPKEVRWALMADAQGNLSGTAVELGQAGQKNNKGLRFPKCPDFSFPELKAGGETKCHFLAEAAGVVALLGQEKIEDDKARKKLQAKHAYFLDLLRRAARTVPALGGLADGLSNPTTLTSLQASLQEHKAKPIDKVTFVLDGRYPLDDPAAQQWWREFREDLSAPDKADETAKPGGKVRKSKKTGRAASAQVICLATGLPVEPYPTHYKIEGLAGVGGQASGDALVSFKQESFCSYGLVQAANAPVGEESARAYADALNQVIRDHSKNLAGTKVAYWYKGTVEKTENPFQLLDDPDFFEDDSGDEAEPSPVSSPTRRHQDQPSQAKNDKGNALQRAKNLLEAVRAGRRPDLAGNYYYALTLSGAAGRVMVRDWMEGPFPDLAANVCAWFDDLAIVARGGQGLAPPPKFMAVLGATVRELKELPGPFVARMWRAAIRREPIPRQALAAALDRFRVGIIDDQPFNHARMGLMRAYLVRKGDEHMEPYLNQEHPAPAYHCGRLMAVLAQIQWAALGDVGAGVVQRYYAAASVTPSLVLGRLIRLSNYHLDKIDNKGWAVNLQNRLAAIMGQFQDRMPRSLDLEGQSLFALGYYQQLAQRFDKKDKDAAADSNDSATEEV